MTDLLMFLANWEDLSWEEGDLNGDGILQSLWTFRFFSELGNDMLWG